MLRIETVKVVSHGKTSASNVVLEVNGILRAFSILVTMRVPHICIYMDNITHLR